MVDVDWQMNGVHRHLYRDAYIWQLDAVVRPRHVLTYDDAEERQELDVDADLQLHPYREYDWQLDCVVRARHNVAYVAEED